MSKGLSGRSSVRLFLIEAFYCSIVEFFGALFFMAVISVSQHFEDPSWSVVDAFHWILSLTWKPWLAVSLFLVPGFAYWRLVRFQRMGRASFPVKIIDRFCSRSKK